MIMTCPIDGYTTRRLIANKVKPGACKNEGKGGKIQRVGNLYVPATTTTRVFDRWYVPKQKRHPQFR